MTLFNYLFIDLYHVTSAVLSLLIAQTIKNIIFLVSGEYIKGMLCTTGGMPSTHSALVSGLTTALFFTHGISSPEFAIAAVFSGIVLYDATNLRHEVSKQASIVNQISQRRAFERGEVYEMLSELLGHTPIQMISGVLIGIMVGTGIYYL